MTALPLIVRCCAKPSCIACSLPPKGRRSGFFFFFFFFRILRFDAEFPVASNCFIIDGIIWGLIIISIISCRCVREWANSCSLWSVADGQSITFVRTGNLTKLTLLKWAAVKCGWHKYVSTEIEIVIGNKLIAVLRLPIWNSAWLMADGLGYGNSRSHVNTLEVEGTCFDNTNQSISTCGR